MSTLPVVKTIQELKADIDTYLQSTHIGINTSSPVAQRYLKVHNGIEITGRFKTNDGTVEGRPFYITVLRQTGASVVEDGYGFAFFKGDGTTYNIYIVDNNSLYGNLVFGETLATPNINGFIKAAKREIKINTEYEFKFNINEDWSTELYMREINGVFAKIVSSDALFDGPLGIGGKQYQSSVTGEWVSMAKGTDIGFGVSNPSGYVWTLKNLQVRKYSAGVPLQLFEIANNGTISQKVQVNYYGTGISKNSNDVVAVSGVDIFIARVVDPNSQGAKEFDKWELLVPAAGQVAGVYRCMTTDIAEHYLFDGLFYIAVTKKFDENNGQLNTAVISTNYLEITNGQNKPLTNRNALDIWIDAVNHLEETTKDITLDADGSTDVTLNSPVFVIKGIYSAGNPNVNILNYSGDSGIRPQLKQSGLEYSNREEITLLHSTYSAIPVSIRYLHAESKVSEIQNYVDSSNIRSPGTDPLIRINPPVIFNVTNLIYRGTISISDLKKSITTFINSKGTSYVMSKSDIISFLYSLGVTYIDLQNLQIELIVFDYHGGWLETESLVDTFSLPTTPCRWYTDEDYMNVVKL